MLSTLDRITPLLLATSDAGHLDGREVLALMHDNISMPILKSVWKIPPQFAAKKKLALGASLDVHFLFQNISGFIFFSCHLSLSWGKGVAGLSL